MKRHGNLFERIASFENLLAAERAAYRGKRQRPAPAGFHYDLEPNLFVLHDELQSGTYQPGAYRAFWIHDPKKRLISAAPYQDRVVHHAVCRVVEPIFDRSFIFDSYANRLGKGTHKAVDRATEFCRRWPYVLKCDVEKFFPSVDHEILLELVARKIKCPRTLDLLGKIVRASNPQEPVVRYFLGDDLFTPHERRRGLPIGNLTSQFLANVMLDPLDHYLKETLRWPAYLRFADDFLVFGDDKRALSEVLMSIRRFLEPLRLRLHPRKCVILPVRLGVPFLGWRVFADHRRLRRSTGVRFQRRLKELAAAYRRGEVNLPEVRASVASWNGHLKHGDTWGLRRRLLRATVFTRSPSPPQATTDHASHGARAPEGEGLIHKGAIHGKK
jgi:retron-type reverse transcriptase